MSFLNILFVLLMSVILSHAKRQSNCREPITFLNFDINRYSGHWYQYSRLRHRFEEGCDCFTAQLNVIDENSFQLMNCCQMTSVSNDTQNCKVGVDKLTLMNPETKESMFKYTLVGSPVAQLLWVIDTDYDNYSIASGCDQINENEEMEIFWIFSRQKEMSETVMKKITDVLRTHNFDGKRLIKQRHGADVCKSERPKHPMKGRPHH